MLKSILQPVLKPVMGSVFGESSETPSIPQRLLTTLDLNAISYRKFNNGVTNVSGAVSSWYDSTGKQNLVSQGTASRRPLITTDGLSFDGVDDNLGNSFAYLGAGTHHTIAIFSSPSAGTTSCQVLAETNALSGGLSRYRIFCKGTTTGNLEKVTQVLTNEANVTEVAYNSFTSDTPVFNNTFQMVDFFDNNASIKTAINGVPSPTTLTYTKGTYTLNRHAIGTFYTSSSSVNSPIQMVLKAIISFPHTNDATVIAQRQGFVAWDLGMQSLLPANHPFKNNAPMTDLITSNDPIPKTISNLALWHDASDASSIIHSAGSVSQWNDKSGNNNHSTEDVGFNKPVTNTTTINGLNTLSFVNQRLKLNDNVLNFSNDLNTVIIVYKNNVTTTDHSYIVTGNPNLSFGNWRYVAQIEGGFNNLRVSQNSTLAINTANISAVNNTNSHVLVTRFNGVNNLKTMIDGKTFYNEFSANVANTGVNSIGVIGNGINAQIAEILIYTKALHNEELNVIGNYIKNKWGITTWSDV